MKELNMDLPFFSFLVRLENQNGERYVVESENHVFFFNTKNMAFVSHDPHIGIQSLGARNF
jgi:hypothetical protein